MKGERTKESEPDAENTESESRKYAPEEQLWEVNQGRAKGNEQKAEYENREQGMGN